MRSNTASKLYTLVNDSLRIDNCVGYTVTESRTKSGQRLFLLRAETELEKDEVDRIIQRLDRDFNNKVRTLTLNTQTVYDLEHQQFPNPVNTITIVLKE